MIEGRPYPGAVLCSQCGEAWLRWPGGICMQCWEAGKDDPLRRKIAEAWRAEPNGPRAEVAARIAHEHYGRPHSGDSAKEDSDE